MMWKIEKRKIKDLVPHAKNPRKMSKHDAEQLQASIEKFGLIDKPVITKDGAIIGGHQRIEILKKMRHKDVECLVCQDELIASELDELCIRLNRVHGEFDFDILANEWQQQDLLQWGFTNVEFEGFCATDESSLSETDREPKGAKCCPHCGKEI